MLYLERGLAAGINLNNSGTRGRNIARTIIMERRQVKAEILRNHVNSQPNPIIVAARLDQFGQQRLEEFRNDNLAGVGNTTIIYDRNTEIGNGIVYPERMSNRQRFIATAAVVLAGLIPTTMTAYSYLEEVKTTPVVGSLAHGLLNLLGK